MLPDDTNVICNGGSLALRFGSTETIGSLSGAGLVQFRQGTGSHLIVGNNNSSTVFAGRITTGGGDGQLTKIGSGTLMLTGDSTYTEGTTISGGTLLAGNSSGSATGTGTVTVATGGTLGGTGSVAGLTIVNSGGDIAPGTSAGVLTVGAALFEAGSTLDIQLGGTGAGEADRLDVVGSAGLGGELAVSLIDSFVPEPFDEFTILTAGTLT
ncbi:hypothetical protein LCGC14_2605870, partial [marine sediment metagenome]